MKTVGSINDLGASAAVFAGSQTGEHAAHRGITMDKLVFVLPKHPFQPTKCPDILQMKGRPLKRDIEDLIRKVQLQTILLSQVIPRRHVDLIVALLSEHFNEWLMELADVTLHSGCQKNLFFHSIVLISSVL
jgi:hypothetical protein